MRLNGRERGTESLQKQPQRRLFQRQSTIFFIGISIGCFKGPKKEKKKKLKYVILSWHIFVFFFFLDFV